MDNVIVTLKLPLSSIRTLVRALDYGNECAEARRAMEKLEAEAWAENAVPFSIDEKPFSSDDDDEESLFCLAEHKRRYENDANLANVRDLVFAKYCALCLKKHLPATLIDF